MEQILQLPYSDHLNIAGLSRLFDNKSECYKLFWFQAILTKVCEGKQDLTYEELIEEMIADSWYMVTEYHLNLGPNDTLEKVVNRIYESANIPPSVKKMEILEWLKACTDKEVNKHKSTLTLNVPYRLQAPFFDSFHTEDWKKAPGKLASIINQQTRLMYYFTSLQGMQTGIHITDEWAKYLKDNQEILRGWIRYNMIIYLQRRNPSVPGISDKLTPPQERKLDKVKKYWKMLATVEEFHEIYGDHKIETKDMSIDHFVPWSYVAHDEFWNLHPTTRSINSSKSNNLPDWDYYFPRLSNLEYQAYQVMWEKEEIHKAFEKCTDEYLNNSEIRYRLYQRGLNKDQFEKQLEEILYPVYQSARTCGFKNWIYDHE